jgi:hypothetical protein
MWITKQEYQETGSTIVHRKCFWLSIHHILYNNTFNNDQKIHIHLLKSLSLLFASRPSQLQILPYLLNRAGSLNTRESWAGRSQW